MDSFIIDTEIHSMTLSGSGSGCTLLDAMQGAPQLLQSVMSSMAEATSKELGLTNFRLISMTTNHAGLRAASGCCLKLSPGASSTQSHLALSKLLYHTQPSIQRLRVEVTTRQGSTQSFTDLSSQAAQLQAFVTTMGSALSTVTHLELIVASTSAATTPKPNIDGQSSESPSGVAGAHSHLDESAVSPLAGLSLSPEASSSSDSIAALLAEACPNITHLGIGGAGGFGHLQAFGQNLASLTSLELLDTCLPVPQLQEAMQQGMLPHVTHIRLDIPPTTNEKRIVERQLYAAICKCPTVTHLHLGLGCLLVGDDWLVLPPNLQQLHCGRLPPGPPPDSLKLNSLRHLSVASCDHPWKVCMLAGILNATPMLITLTNLDARVEAAPQGSMPLVGNKRRDWSQPECTLFATRCTNKDLACLAQVHARVQQGLTLRNAVVSLSAASHRDGVPVGRILVRDVLCKLPVLPWVTACVVTEYEEDDGEGVSYVAHALPNLSKLSFVGDWGILDMQQLKIGPLLRELRWHTTCCVIPKEVVDLLVRTPLLQQLFHSALGYQTLTEQARRMLREAGCTDASSWATYQSPVFGGEHWFKPASLGYPDFDGDAAVRGAASVALSIPERQSDLMLQYYGRKCVF